MWECVLERAIYSKEKEKHPYNLLFLQQNKNKKSMFFDFRTHKLKISKNIGDISVSSGGTQVNTDR